MSRCLNLTGDNEAKFNELVKAVGRKEAVREFLEAADNDRPIGTPIQVKEKIRSRTESVSDDLIQVQVNDAIKQLESKVEDPMFQDPETAVGMGILLADFNNKSLSLTEQNRTQAIEIIGKLSEQTGVGFNIVSVDEAVRITANSANPYNPSKGPAFVYAGEVYFVGDKLNTKIAFHEFSHPIIRALRLNNPELFEKLYQEAINANPEYLQQAVREYEDLKQKAENEDDLDLRNLYSEDFDYAVKEEVLVKALTEEAVFANENLKANDVKKSFFDNLLYNIRQFFRKLFGSKINISKLKGNTTLADLAKMLVEGGNFEINTEEISDDLIVAYFNDQNKYIEDMRKVVEKTGNRFLLETMTRVYEGAASQIRYLQSTANFEDIVDLLTDEFNRGDLQEIKSNLGRYAGLINSVADEKVKDIELIENEVKSFVTSLMRLDFAIKKMQEHLNELKDDIDQDTLHKADYYRNTLDYWEKYINQFQKALDNAGADANSPINSIISSIRGNIRKADVSINAIQTVGVADTLWNSLKIMALEGDKIFQEKIERLKDRKASDNALEKEYISYYGLTRADLDKYNQLSERIERGDVLSLSEVEEHAKLKLKTIDAIRVTKEKIAAKLKGEGRDAKWGNSFFEGYLYNTDPVIGGFAVYFTNNMTEVDGRIKNRLQEFADLNIKKLLQDAGINLNMVGESGKVLGFIDSIGEFDPETGTFKEKKVWSLLGATKNHRFVIDQFNYEIRELEKKYQYSRNDQDKLLLIDKINEKNKHLREWFYQEFDDQYYKDTTLVRDENDTVGKLAQFARDKVLSDIRSLTQPLKNEIDILDKHKEIEAAWRNYRLLFSNFNIDGTLKTGDDLLIAKRLQEYREKSRKYYEFVERPGVFQNALQNVESEIKSELIKQGYTPGHRDYKEIFNEKRNLWLEMNTRVAIKPEFYQRRTEILEKINRILSKLPSTQANEFNFTEYWKEILDAVAGYRDDDGQPIGHEISEGRKEKVRKAQQAMEKAKEAWAGFTGLSREDYDRLTELSAIRESGERLSKEDFDEWVRLINEQKNKGLSKNEIQALNKAFAELNELQGKGPTEYFLDQLNSWLEKMDLTEVYEQFALTSFDEKNIGLLYENEDLRNKLFEASPEFEKWFNANHIKKKVKGQERYDRLYIWNVIRPKDPKYYETTNIKDENGNIIPIKGLPKLKFYSRVVKKEFRTGYDKVTGKVKPIVGVHIDNRGILENGWLPKIKEGSPYINEEYFRLKNADPNSLDGKKFKALEALTKFHLKSQEGLPRKDRLYLDFPRFEMDNLEMAQAGIVKKRAEEKMNFIKRIFKKLIEWFKGEIKDDPAQNFDAKLKLVRVDAFGDQIDNIPIQGLYNLDYQETSTDIVNSLIRFMMGAEHKKQLLKMNPTAKALKNILEKNEPKDMEKANLWDAVNRNIIGYANKKGKYVRKEAINNLYEREFLGKRTTGFLSDQKWAINLQNFMFKRAAFAFFTFNPTSDLKNQIGAKYQSMIEAAAGENLTVKTFAKGQAWSAKYMFQGTFGMYNAKKGLDDQIGDAFDFVQDRFKQRAGEPFTDTVFKDVARFTFLQGPRKLLELEAASQTFAGMMYKKKVSRNGVDIDYMDAWELDASGLLKLKDGIDIRYSNTSTKYRIDKNDTAAKLSKMYNIPEEEMRKIMEEEWNVKRRLQKVKEIEAKRKEKLDIARTESERQSINSKYDFLVNKQLEVEIDNVLFKLFRNKVQAVMQKLNGAYARFAQPEAARYILFRFVLNFRRFFITSLMRRFGKERWNVGYGLVDEGYYRTFLKGVKEAIIKMDPLILFGKNDKRKLAATLRVLAEVGGLLLLDLIVGAFGFDLDDEDKYEKLRQMSGPLPIGFVDEDENDFNLFGWLGLHTLNLAYQVRAENEQFLPLPGFGLDNFKDLLDIKSIAMGPTIDSYVTILGDMLNFISGNERQFYKRRSGPYDWQQEGSRKLWNHIGKSFGINATFVDPASALTNIVKAQNLSSI